MDRIVIAAMMAVLLSACGLADIRPDNVKAQMTQAQQEEGERLFARMVETHGGAERWNAFEKVETTFKDTWNNWLFFQITPYAENSTMASLESYIHRFPYSRIAFLEGEAKGEVWMATGDTIKRLSAGRLETQAADADTFFTVFVQNPEVMIGVMFRLMSADQFVYAGRATWRGQEYDTVLLSWGSLEPQEGVDQWLLYINRETGRLDATEFTVRMSGGSQVAFYHYDDFKEVEGMLLPHTMGAYLSKEDDEPLHTYYFGELMFSRHGAPAQRSAAR